MEEPNIIESYAETLLTVSIDPGDFDGIWHYPGLTESCIIKSSEADIVKFIVDTYPNFKTNFYVSECALSNFTVSYTNIPTEINKFRNIYGEQYASFPIYGYLKNGIKACYRIHIEKVIDELFDNIYDYDPTKDNLKLELLQIVKGKIVIDPEQTLEQIFC